MAMTNHRQRSAILYGRQLRTALEETGTSIYRLSRKLNPDTPESARSNIQRYLAGKVLPGIESRHELAETLERPELRSVPEDEEEIPRMPSAFEADLLSALRRVVDERLSQEAS